MKKGLDLSEAIYGTLLSDEDYEALKEGGRVTLLLFQAGGTAMKPTVVIDTIHISELGSHLEEFSGRDDTHPDFDDDLSRGSTLHGMFNRNTSTVFITRLDGETVAQEPSFYNAAPPADQ